MSGPLPVTAISEDEVSREATVARRALQIRDRLDRWVANGSTEHAAVARVLAEEIEALYEGVAAMSTLASKCPAAQSIVVREEPVGFLANREEPGHE